MKALIIRGVENKPLDDVLQIIRKEGSNLYPKPNKVKVLEIVTSKYGVIGVVQNLDGCNPDEQHNK